MEQLVEPREMQRLSSPDSDCQLDVTHESTGSPDDAGLGRTQEEDIAQRAVKHDVRQDCHYTESPSMIGEMKPT